MKPKIIVCDGMDKEIFQTLKNNPELDVHPEPKNSQDTINSLLTDANALIIRSATTITSETLSKAPNLKLVIRAGEGTDNIDKVACAKAAVKVANTPGANNNSAAEHAIALMMTVLRKTAAADATMKNGGWDKNKYTGLELSNKKIGVVGFGRIGQIVAKRLAGFEPDLLFFDPFIEKSDLPYARKAKDLNEIFETCDIITLHTPLMDQTEGMVNADLLNKMQSHAVLINASRGKIVDENALHMALKERKFRAAGFDVFATEPLEENSPLRSLENIVLTPHLGASTEEAQVRVGEMAVHQVHEFFINNNLLNEVKA